MTLQLLQAGLLAIVPGIGAIIVIGTLISISFMTGRATALNHLIKYHIKEIRDDVINEITEENVKYRLNIERLERDNKKFVEVLSGIRYILR